MVGRGLQSLYIPLLDIGDYHDFHRTGMAKQLSQMERKLKGTFLVSVLLPDLSDVISSILVSFM